MYDHEYFDYRRAALSSPPEPLSAAEGVGRGKHDQGEDGGEDHDDADQDNDYDDVTDIDVEEENDDDDADEDGAGAVGGESQPARLQRGSTWRSAHSS